MKKMTMVLALAWLLCGCTGSSTGEADIEIVVNNASAWDCVLTIAVDGQQSEVTVAAGGSQTFAEMCPGIVELVSQTLDPEGTATITSFSGQANSQLAKGTNYICGDRIVIEIAEGSTTIGSQTVE